MTAEQIRANDLAQLKGSSTWLTTLPLAREGYVLNKREFYDAIYLRYRWQLKRLPTYCACGKSFTVDHALSCLKGGFIHRRHDEIRDLLAAAIDEVAYDVSTEPALAPLTGEVLPPSANSADDARVDIAARGFWQRCEKVSCKTWNLESGILESWNPGILESWNLGILESYHITAKYVIIKMILFSTYATYCSACDNLIFGELAEADLGNILSVYTIRCRI